MGFVRDLVQAGSIGFVEHVGLIFVAKNAGAQRFITDARASNRHFLRPPSGPLLTGEGLCHVEFQGAPQDAQNWFVGSADIKNAFHQMRSLGWLQAFFPLSNVLASEVGCAYKTVNQKRLAPESFVYPVPTTLPIGILLGDVFLSRCHGPQHARGEVLILFFLFVVTTHTTAAW